MKKKIVIFFKYFGIFFFFFLLLSFIYNNFMSDLYTNYGYSYAISRGQIPYKDFNLVVPLFSVFVYSIFLLFSKSIICLFLGQALFLTIIFYILDKIMGNKKSICLLVLLFPFILKFPSLLYPNYNFIVFFLFIILIYLESRHYNDYIIGLVLGLLIITKHTIGFFMIIPSLIYYLKKRDVLLKRGIGLLLPLIVFFLYLIISKTIYSFIDLCVLGLFDFGTHNSSFNIIYLIIMISIFIICIYKYYHNKNIDYLYMISFLMMGIPIVDKYHISIIIFTFLIICLKNSKFSINKSILILINLLILIIPFLQFLIISNNKYIDLYSFKNVSFIYLNEKEYKNILKVNKFLKEKNTYYLMGANFNYLFELINNKDIKYTDGLYYGNYGYDGTRKIVDYVKNIHDAYFVIYDNEFDKNNEGQYLVEVPLYIINNCDRIKKIDGYSIYYKE